MERKPCEFIKSPEPITLQPFTHNERRRLQRVGYSIYSLTHQTIKAQREMGNLIKCFGTTSKVETAASMVGEVAFNPKHIFSAESNEGSFYEQEALIEESGVTLRRTLHLPHHIRTVMGGVADYTQLALLFLEEIGVQSFRERYGLKLIRTNTPVENSHVAVGFFTLSQGIPVYKCNDLVRLKNLFVAPLVVSIKK